MQKGYFSRLFTGFHGLLFSAVCFGQEIIKLPFNEKIGPEDGLSSYNASKIIQDKFGFIWIATQDGLDRYDGREFTVYNKSAGSRHRLLGNVINDMTEDTARNLFWATTSYGGLNGIDLITGEVRYSLQAVISPGGLHNDWLRCINVSHGKIWIGTYDGLNIYDPDTGELAQVELPPFSIDPSHKELVVNFIFTDSHDHVWVNFPDQGLAVYSAMTRKLLHYYSASSLGFHEPQSYLQFFGRIAAVNDSSFMTITAGTFKLFHYDREGRLQLPVQDLALNRYFGNTPILTFRLDHSEKLWFATASGLFMSEWKKGTFRKVADIAQKGKKDWLKSISYILKDNQDNLWIAGERGVMFSCVQEPAFIPYTEKNDLSNKMDFTNYVYPQDDSVLYVCAQDGFFSVNTHSGVIRSLDHGANYNFCFRSRQGTMIVSNDNGLFVYRPGKGLAGIDTYYPELKPLRREVINSAVCMGDSLIIMGSETNKGIHLWNLKSHSLRTVQLSNDIIRNNIINNVFKASDSLLFILFDNAIGTYEVATGKTRKFQIPDPEQKMPLSLLFDVCQANNDYWMAVYGRGIVRLNKDFKIVKIYGAAEGLTNTGVYKVFQYRDSLVFASSNNGLFCIDIRKGRVHQFLKDDGLNSNNFEEGCGYSAPDLFYAGGEDGFSKIIPSLISSNHAVPQLFIDQVRIDAAGRRTDTFNLGLNEYDVPENAQQTRVSFSAINFIHPGRTLFAYRIKELNTEWISSNIQNFVDLIGLEPGSYTLEVKAANEDGIWSPSKQLVLTFLPKWYQTRWFKLFVFAAIFFILYGLYRYRIDQIRKQQQIRKDIASDLHDDIGSTLNTVKIFTHLAKKEQKEEHLTHIEESLAEATMGLRDMIWVLDDSQDTVQELCERIKKFAIPITGANDIHFECNVDAGLEDLAISKAVKRNLLLIAKETINNCIKYSFCKHIQVSIRQENSRLLFAIRDDGKGFDTQAPSQGNGLKNIQQRATQIHYKSRITSFPDKGALVEIIEL